MPRFRRRPVVIDAVQYTGQNYAELKAFAGKGLFEEGPTMGEGRMRVRPGDWIIREESGRIVPCSHEIFSKEYEPWVPPRRLE